MFLELFLVLFSSALIFGLNINQFPLHNWDEAWYAEIIKNLVQGGHSWLVPFWNGHYFFDKPPLYFWLSFPLFKLFGPGEWQTRIVSVLAGAGAVLLIFLIGKKLFNQRAGIFSVIVFLSLGQVVDRFSQGDLDALLIFFFLAAFYFFLLSQRKFFLILSGISVGLGFLVKSWLLGLFPMILIVFYVFFSKEKTYGKLFLIFLISILSSAWWYALAYFKFGQNFVNWYLFSPAAGYLGMNLNFSKNFPVFILKDIGFWFLIIPAFLFGCKKIALGKKILPFLLMIFVFIFSLLFLDQQFNWYLLPAYPLIALIIGYLLDRLVQLNKLAYFLIFLILGLQIFSLWQRQIHDGDRSELMARLGKTAHQIIPQNDTLILGDSDFTSFLFYSDHRQIYTLSESGGNQREWWILKKKDLPEFVNKHHPAWVISNNLKGLPVTFKENQIVAVYKGYSFLKID